MEIPSSIREVNDEELYVEDAAGENQFYDELKSFVEGEDEGFFCSSR